MQMLVISHRPGINLSGCYLDKNLEIAKKKLDESTARRQLKSPRSLSGRSIYLTLVTKWSWSWSWMTYCHPLVQCQSDLPFWDTAISKFDHENPWSRSCVWSKVKVMLTFKIQRSRLWSRSNPLVTFETWNSIIMFAFCFVAIGPLLVEI